MKDMSNAIRKAYLRHKDVQSPKGCQVVGYNKEVGGLIIECGDFSWTKIGDSDIIMRRKKKILNGEQHLHFIHPDEILKFKEGGFDE